jgi:quercetin dioxygenase-like cupin family protein
MKEFMKEWDNTPYPEFIRNLPEIDIKIEGVRGWLLQGGDKQIAFFDIEPIGEVPPHSHSAQWGIVVEGKMRLTIGEETRIYQKGDWYFIPEGVTHSATFLTRFQAIDIFDEPERYTTK